MSGASLMRKVGLDYLLKTKFSDVAGQPVILADQQVLDTPQEGMVVGQIKVTNGAGINPIKIANNGLESSWSNSGTQPKIASLTSLPNTNCAVKFRIRKLKSGESFTFGLDTSTPPTTVPELGSYTAQTDNRLTLIGGTLLASTAIGTDYYVTVIREGAYNYHFLQVGGQWQFICAVAADLLAVSVNSYVGIVPVSLDASNIYNFNFAFVAGVVPKNLPTFEEFSVAPNSTSSRMVRPNARLVTYPLGTGSRIRFKMDAVELNYWELVIDVGTALNSRKFSLRKVVNGVAGSILISQDNVLRGVSTCTFRPELGGVKVYSRTGGLVLSYTTVDTFNQNEYGVQIVNDSNTCAAKFVPDLFSYPLFDQIEA